MKSLTPKLVTRSEWKALTPTSGQRRGKYRGLGGGQAVSKVVFSNTQTVPCFSKAECIRTVQRLQVDHMKRLGLPDIRYNFLIGGDGHVYEGRGWLDRAEDDVIEVTLIEDFTTDEDEPYHIEMIRQFSYLILYGMHQGLIHKDFNIIENMIFKQPKSYFIYYQLGLFILVISLLIYLFIRRRTKDKNTV